MTNAQLRMLTLDQLMSVFSAETGYHFRIHHQIYADVFIRTLDNVSLYLFVDSEMREDGFFIQLNYLPNELYDSFVEVLQGSGFKVPTSSLWDNTIRIDIPSQKGWNTERERFQANVALHDVVLLLESRGLVRRGNSG